MVDFVGETFEVAPHLYSSKLLVSGLANNPVMEAIATSTPVITVEIGEIAALYGQYANVHVMDYPPGGVGRIEEPFLTPLVTATAERIATVLNEHPVPPASPAPAGRLYSWEQRLQDELDLYDGLFSPA